MKFFAKGSLVCALGIGLKAHAGVGVCELYRGAYKTEIKPKITAGIPFELMSTLFESGRLVRKKVVHIKFNLWDEVITLKSGDRLVTQIPLNRASEEICKYLEFTDVLDAGKKYVFRILLNPMWAERMARLQISTGREIDEKKLIGVNWKKLAEEMPSDKVLLEREIQP